MQSSSGPALPVNTSSTPHLIGSAGDSLREAFGKALVEWAPHVPRLVVLDADINGGTGAHHFLKAFPRRFFQFGIAEQNMMAAAGGMASTGLIPVVTTFAVFCLRAYEQARLSIGYSRRNVKIAGSHTGVDTGPDGASAQALEDIAAFRALPGFTVIAPADQAEMRLAVKAMLEFDGPVYLRTGRSPAKRVFGSTHEFQIGQGRIVRPGRDVTIIACGAELARSLVAADILQIQGISAQIVNMATIKPLDVSLIQRCVEETGAIVTAEDHSVIGGLGGAVAEAVAQYCPCPVEFIGVRDVFGQSGEPEELAEVYGLTPPFIADAVHRVLKRKGQRERRAA